MTANLILTVKSSVIIPIAAAGILVATTSLAYWIYQRSFVPLHGHDAHAEVAPYIPAKTHEVHLHPNAETPAVSTDLKNFKGQPVELSCANCHSTKTPNRELVDGTDLKDFHQGLTVVHGERSCLSCHDSENYDNLHLADGTSIPFSDTKRLCAQCHGPQHRDYEHGSHGGMTGYWDLSRGPRVRNTCTVCHDPHAPAYPQVMPAPFGAREPAPKHH